MPMRTNRRAWHVRFESVLLSIHHTTSAGGNGPFMSPLPTKLLMKWEDITTDHRDVPAFEKTTWWFNNNVRFPFFGFRVCQSCCFELFESCPTIFNTCPTNFRHMSVCNPSGIRPIFDACSFDFQSTFGAFSPCFRTNFNTLETTFRELGNSTLTTYTAIGLFISDDDLF